MINEALIKVKFKILYVLLPATSMVFKIIYFQLGYIDSIAYKWLWLNVIEYVSASLSLT